MKTKLEIATELKLEHPTIKVGSEEVGYTQLTPEEYEAEIAKWVEHIFTEAEKVEKINQAKETAEAKLAALGLTAEDLKAIGL
jgi:hypothetical protein